MNEQGKAAVTKDGIAARLSKKHRLWIINEISHNTTNAIQPSTSERRELAPANRWHWRMAHISRYTVGKHRERNATDIQVLPRKSLEQNSQHNEKCDISELSKLSAIISRRQIRARSQPYEVLHAELIYINPIAYNGEK